jgi:hypothetical protein
MDQAMLDNAFKNDKQFQTYGSDLFKTNAENVFRGTKATYDTMLEPDRYDTQKLTYGRDGLRARDSIMQLENALKPENVNARVKVYDNNFQSPAAMLEANAATAQITDAAERARVAGEVAQGYGGALGAQAVYGQSQRDANSLNMGNMIMGGSLDQANERMAQAGVNMRIEAGDKEGTVVIVTPDGRKSAPMDPSNAAKIFNDQAGAKAGQSQAYTDRTSAAMFDAEQRLVRENAKLAQRDNYLKYKMRTEEGRRLNSAYQAAVKEGDKAKIQEAWNDVQTFQQRSAQEFEQGGGTYSPSVQPGPRMSDADLITGKPPAPAAPAAPAAPVSAPNPAAAAPEAPAPTYQPMVATEKTKTFAPGEVTDDVMAKYEDVHAAAKSRLGQIQADWQRANSLDGRRSVSDEMRAKIKKALDEATKQADIADRERAAAKRAYLKDKGNQAYNPYRAMKEAGATTMNAQLNQRYGGS